jgi:glycerol-3-phosphate dehydrogenase
MSFSSKYRTSKLEEVSSRVFDVCIIGGGITGAGIALDAVSRGLSVILLEKNDFASGTSSRSTKLIHGGLRYLQQREFLIVSQVGRERAILHRLAPHLVVPDKMLLPFTKGFTFGKFSTSLGLWVYDFLAGVRGEDKRKMYGKRSILEKEPLLDASVVLGGGIYAEYRTDDARLTLEVIKTAHESGAICLNYCEVTSLNYQQGTVDSLVCKDTIDGVEHKIQFRTLVNATGPWVDEIRELDHSLSGKHLFLTKGVHIVVPFDKLPLQQSIYFDVADGRMIFAIPRGEITYIGTTDTPYKGNREKIVIETADIQYLLSAVNLIFPQVEIFIDDVISAWAGLRPLIYEPGKSASELSRKDEIFVASSGLISIAGGKLTGYRKMAEKVVNLIEKRIKGKSTRCKTKQISLCHGVFSTYLSVLQYKNHITESLRQYHLSPVMADYLVHLYGKQVDIILDGIKTNENKTGIGLLLSELTYCIEHEMVLSLKDFFVRRTGRLFFDPQSIPEAIIPAADLCGNYLGWSSERQEREVLEMQYVLDHRLAFC